jgi:hypothetical protein
MKGQGGNFNAYYQVKEDNLKRLFNSNTWLLGQEKTVEFVISVVSVVRGKRWINKQSREDF